MDLVIPLRDPHFPAHRGTPRIDERMVFGQPSGTTEQTHVGPTHKSTGEDPEITNPKRRASREGSASLLVGAGAFLLLMVVLVVWLQVREDPAVPNDVSSSPSRTGSATAPATAGSSPPSAPQKRPPGPVVLLISVDGLNTDAIRELDATGQVPAFARLMREGAGTLNARTSFELTQTLPNHTGMLTGRRIDGSTGTGVRFNEDNGGTLESLNGRYVPGVFDVAHDHGMSTTFLAEKDKFNFLLRSWDSDHGAADRVGPDNGRDKVDTGGVDSATSNLATLLRQMAHRPARLGFLHIAAPDLAGHAHGFMGRRYLEAVVRADRTVGQVLDLIRSEPGLRARTTVIFTSDHGGRGANHGDPTSSENYRVPFYVWGRDVAAGTDLYRLNPGRRDPGTARPGYEGPQPIRNLDAANLMLSLLGLDPLPDTLPGGLRVLRTR